MKIAIPLFNRRISPRFDYAQTFLFASAKNLEVTEKQIVDTKTWTVFDRVQNLVGAHIDTLICGGISAFSAEQLRFHRIRILASISGNAESVLSHFLKGDLNTQTPWMFNPYFPGTKQVNAGRQFRNRGFRRTR